MVSCLFGLKDGGSDGGKHKDKVIASQLVNLKLFATIVPSQSQIEVHLQPSSSKVVFATLHLTLSCVFLRQGKATYVFEIFMHLLGQIDWLAEALCSRCVRLSVLLLVR